MEKNYIISFAICALYLVFFQLLNQDTEQINKNFGCKTSREEIIWETWPWMRG